MDTRAYVPRTRMTGVYPPGGRSAALTAPGAVASVCTSGSPLALGTGSRATACREPGQVRKEAAISGLCRVSGARPRASAARRVRRVSAGPVYFARQSSVSRGGAFRGASVLVPEVPPAELRRRRRSVAHHAHAAQRRRRGLRRARVPLHRPARHRQDHHRAHPRQGAQLREGPDAGLRTTRARTASTSPRGATRTSTSSTRRRAPASTPCATRSSAKVNYAATRGGWKVYIIDEVHMLSTSAFNALLKTLEEPPSHTVFILCTTHPHKVPETIHSRCQRFDFHRISASRTSSSGSRSSPRPRASRSPTARSRSSRKHAAGGMRDAISHARAARRRSRAARSRSTTSRGCSARSTPRCSSRRPSSSLRPRRRRCVPLRRASSPRRGVDMAEFVKGLVAHFRDLFVIAAVGDGAGIVDTTERGRSARLDAPGGRLRRGAARARARRPRPADGRDCAGRATRGSRSRWRSRAWRGPRATSRSSRSPSASPRSRRARRGACGPPAPQRACRGGGALPSASAKAPGLRRPPGRRPPRAPPVPRSPTPRAPRHPHPLRRLPAHGGCGGAVRLAVRRSRGSAGSSGEVTLDARSSGVRGPASSPRSRSVRAATAQLFVDTRRSTSTATTLVVEFPAEQKFAMELAERPGDAAAAAPGDRTPCSA